ncbi:carboxypeptidase regulatory-like domain-containing protein [Paludisphaera rhizosphaerae]|uniref:carboxypeptidase regulatory-like domain-containing protein n=1 Tax=Paludisphaera rhizosphaerae TaxID=2711216 RepID=UPI0013EB9810|nr:carboxypeptidase regulatory-like domain-containing protein [Paludisphaera rhizosphaerae]
MPRLSLILASTLALAFAGCGGGDVDLGYRLPVQPTSGTLTWKGGPVKGALVRFHPVDPQAVRAPADEQLAEPSLTTETDADGRFIMSSYLADDGVPAGDYVVTVAPSALEAIQPIDATVAPAETPEDVAPAKGRKPAAPSFSKVYRDAATSPLKASVKEGTDNTFIFDLDAVDAKPARSRTVAVR